MTEPAANTGGGQAEGGAKLDLASGLFGAIEDQASSSDRVQIDPTILLETPTELMKIYPYTRMSEEEGKLVGAVLARDARYNYGIINVARVVLLEMSRTAGQDGAARKEYVEVMQSAMRVAPSPPENAQRAGLFRRLIG